MTTKRDCDAIIEGLAYLTGRPTEEIKNMRLAAAPVRARNTAAPAAVPDPPSPYDVAMLVEQDPVLGLALHAQRRHEMEAIARARAADYSGAGGPRAGTDSGGRRVSGGAVPAAPLPWDLALGLKTPAQNAPEEPWNPYNA